MPGTTVEALVESLRHDMVCHDADWTYDLLPEGHRLVGVDESFARALAALAVVEGPARELIAAYDSYVRTGLRLEHPTAPTASPR